MQTEIPFHSNQVKASRQPHIYLGRRCLSDVLPLMDELVLARKKNEISNTLLLVRHPSVYTLGRGIQASIRNNLAKEVSEESLESLKKRLPYPVLPLTRGGGLTFHDEGQVIGYPIVQLDPKKNLGIRPFLSKLERYLIQTLTQVFPNQDFQTDSKATGIWLNKRKVVSIGIAIRNWVSYHGFAIHLFTDRSAFYKIEPCGLEAQTIANIPELIGDSSSPEHLFQECFFFLKKNFSTFFLS